MQEKVVVTGMDMITALGLSAAETWEGIAAGRSGVRKISLFDPEGLQTQIAAEVPASFDALWPKYIKKRAAEQMTRVTRMAVSAARQAVTMSGIDFSIQDRSRCAAILGVVTTGNTTSEKGTNSQNRILKSMNNAMSAWISLDYKLEGPNYTVASACASSAFAVCLAWDMIRNGQADVVIAGGADSIINREEIDGFNGIYALSVNNDQPETASRPFSADRDGFVIGEGAGMLILESEKNALKRGAKIYAEIAGYGMTSEAYNIMAPAREGEGIALTIGKALKHAGIQPEEVQYINAHGTSTTLNDLYETMAIKKVFGDRAAGIPVSSSKSMIGHTVGAAGAIELIITIMGMNHGLLPPTINLHTPDPVLDLDYVPNVARKAEIHCALSNSFAFGGHNAVIAIRSCSGTDCQK